MRTSYSVLMITCLCAIAVHGQDEILPSDPSNNLPDCANTCDAKDQVLANNICEGPYFCCAISGNTFCCQDRGHMMAGVEQANCDTWKWWTTNWKTMIGLLVAAIVLVAITSACYYGCAVCAGRGPLRRRGASSISTVDRRCHSISSDIFADGRNVSFCFDPESPCAFKPPDYSLPEKPPSYAELLQKEYSNTAFSLADENNKSEGGRKRESVLPMHDILPTPGEPPPAYTAEDLGPTRRHSCATSNMRTQSLQTRRRMSLDARALEASQANMRTRRRSTTCIAPNFNGDLPPVY